MSDFLALLEEKIGYEFSKTELVIQSLTHKSYSNEQSGAVAHNERLEFLGDAVLELAVSDWVYHRYPEIPEGGLTRLRAEVVSEKGLCSVAKTLDLGAGLRLGKGEEKSGGRGKPSLLSDALEAVLGAVYQDGGFASAYRVVEKLFSSVISQSANLSYGSDYKTCLQERFQALHNCLPEYHLVETSGPDHDRLFTIEVRFDNQLLGRGSGPSKKGAEQKAAAAALDHSLLKKEN
jgi:ribonuclease III